MHYAYKAIYHNCRASNLKWAVFWALNNWRNPHLMCAAILFVVKTRTPGGEKMPPAHHRRVSCSTRDQRGAFSFFYRCVSCHTAFCKLFTGISIRRPFVSHAHDWQKSSDHIFFQFEWASNRMPNNMCSTSTSHFPSPRILHSALSLRPPPAE